MKEELKSGEPIRVMPAITAICEYLQNGWTEGELICGRLDENGCLELPFDAYSNGHGYYFNWGHIIESHSTPCDDPMEMTTWNFCLDHVLAEAHNEGLILDDLANLCSEYLEKVADDTWPVIVGEGDVMSCFELFVISIDDELGTHTQRTEQARHWLTDTFLPSVIPELIAFLREKIVR